ncbi:MAG: DUF808 family protein [Comamonadaceae bacterium]|nr:DUF808 family protein [Comamonadaceae bacterium]
MAAASLLALLDDIATVLDDVAAADQGRRQEDRRRARRRPGAQRRSRSPACSADRELPVVWAVAKGSLLNKAILVPAALAISAFAPWAVDAAADASAALFLCFEGVEKLAHKLLHRGERRRGAHAPSWRGRWPTRAVDLVALRAATRSRARSAPTSSSRPRSSSSRSAPWPARRSARRSRVLVGIALLMTVGVYGLVAGIVKLDDARAVRCSRAGDGGRGAAPLGPRHPARRAVADEGACRWPARRRCSWSAAASSTTACTRWRTRLKWLSPASAARSARCCRRWPTG